MSKLKKELKFQDTYLYYPQVFFDNRGHFFEQYNKKTFKEIGFTFDLKQTNISISKKNVLRGIHFQFRNPQSQMMQLIQGEIDLVLVDFRINSRTFKKKIYMKLSEKKQISIITPPGVGSAYLTKSNKNIILYQVSKFYEPKNEVGIIWNDPILKINWKTSKPILSNKDKNNITMKEFLNYVRK